MNQTDRQFAVVLDFLRKHDLSARTDRRGSTTIYARPEKKHKKVVCTQPSQCLGVAICPHCELVPAE